MNRSAVAPPPRSTTAASSAPVRFAPITDSEIDAAAQQMNTAGMSAGGGGARLLTLLLDPALDLDTLVDRIKAEPALSIRLLRVANSAYYGQTGRVEGLSRAAQVVGLQALRGIAAASCFDTLVAPRGGSPLLQALRLHSLATACAAEALAALLLPAAAPQAFMAGLLHDIGHLVHWRLRSPIHPALTAGARPSAGAASDGHPELDVYGATHEHCGRRMIDAWDMPTSLSQAVALHGNGRSLPGAAKSPLVARPLVAGPVAGHGTAAAPDLPQLLAWSDQIATFAGFLIDGDAHADRQHQAADVAGVTAVDGTADTADATAASAACSAACSAVAAALPQTLRRLGVMES